MAFYICIEFSMPTYFIFKNVIHLERYSEFFNFFYCVLFLFTCLFYLCSGKVDFFLLPRAYFSVYIGKLKCHKQNQQIEDCYQKQLFVIPGIPMSSHIGIQFEHTYN